MGDDARMSSDREGETNLTWGVIADEGRAVFAPTQLVAELTQLRAAIDSASTWGEFRARVPARYVQEVHELLEEAPADGADFDPDEISGYGDGDWPEWLHQVMLDWMPKDLIERFGTVEQSVHNGPFLEVEPAAADDLAHALEERGYSCTHDDAAIAAAAGWA